jgi:hypothetical protein
LTSAKHEPENEVTNLTVRQMLPDNYQDMDDAIEKYSREHPWSGQASLPGFLWQMLGDQVTSKIHSVLEGDVFGYLAAGWCKAREIRQSAIKSLREPDKPLALVLGKHELSTGIQPIAEVTLGDFGKTELPFDLLVKAKFESAVITLKNGRLISAGSGNCEVSALLKFREYTLYDGPSIKTAMTEPLRFEPGLVIASESAEPAHGPQ